MNNRSRKVQTQFKLKPTCLAVLLAFGVQTAEANPIGGAVVNGQASFNANGNTLTVTNTPGTIINWQGFSIGGNEATIFAQQSAASTVLNRVVTNSPSSILGALQSNGRVFLINPNGIVFGAGATVDVAGLVATTLNLSNADFLAGRYNFTQVPGAQNISNAGSLTARNGGEIYLIAPNVDNSGIINAPNGEVLLAAGHSVQLVNSLDPNLRVSITAPAGDATNVGQLVASAGSLGLFGTVVRNSGIVNASSAVAQGGKIVFKASLRVEAGGTISANGTSGGSVNVSAAHALDPNAPGVVVHTGSIQAQGVAGAGGAVRLSADNILSAAAINVDGTTAGGLINLQAANRALSTSSAQYAANSILGIGGDILVSANVSNYTSGTYSATGITGGNITFAGNEIKLAGAKLDASGTNGGGNVHIGGLMHGAAGFSAQGIALANATNVLTNSSTSIKADAQQTGNGGQVVLWSDRAMRFKGSISATGGALGGNGGMAEISGLTSLGYGGLVNLSAAKGLNGTLLLDPRNITIVPGAGALTSVAGPNIVLELIDPTPGANEMFGQNMAELPNGNIVITSPMDSFVALNSGAVYFYSSTGTLISTLTGSLAQDGVGGFANGGGSGFVTVLKNGNFVVVSPGWNNNGIISSAMGAVTWGSATTGISGVVSSANSLVGSVFGDNVGSGGVTALNVNGNYVVSSPTWRNGAVLAAGAVTWGNGATGTVGAVSALNSLVGSSANDSVGQVVTALLGGNYVVGSPWSNGAILNVGAATWGNGLGGTVGVISAANSLVGSTAADGVGGRVTSLSNGNYVVSSLSWSNGAAASAGAVTWGSGATGISGTVSVANSLVGTTANDQVGLGGVIPLSNGNYVVNSYMWNNGAALSAGAVTWGNGAGGTVGAVSATNSLVGSTSSDEVGNGSGGLGMFTQGVAALSNGHYVVASPKWDSTAPVVANVGAVTWGNGATLGPRTVGVITAANSLVGSVANDGVGSAGVTALPVNGNYVVASTTWGGMKGAATWGNGLGGTVGVVSAANSLVGSLVNDGVGSYVTALTNGNYVVNSNTWKNGLAAAAGAVTWGNGTTGIVGTVTAANSLVGTTALDQVGWGGVFALANGNYVVSSISWNNGVATAAGAVTWGNGLGGTVGAVSALNSLVGSTLNDQVGSGNGLSGIVTLSNGNYVVRSMLWNNGLATRAGAVTWGNGATGATVGVVSAANSLVGTTTNDMVGYCATCLTHAVLELSDGNYVVRSGSWNNGAIAGAGAATWGNGLVGGTVGAVSASNSLVGTTAFGSIVDFVTPLTSVAHAGTALIGWTTATNGALANAGRAVVLGATVAPPAAVGTLFANTPATDVTIGAGNIAATLNLGTNVVLQANNDITQQVGAGITATGLGSLTLQAGRSVFLSDVINIAGALSITANDPLANAANRTAGTAVLDASLATITASAMTFNNFGVNGGNILLNNLSSAAGTVTSTALGSTTLTGANSMLNLDVRAPAGVAGSGTLNVNAGTTTVTAVGGVTIAAGGAIKLNGGVLNAKVANNGSMTIAPSFGGTYNSAYSGTGTLNLFPMGGQFSFAPVLAGGYVFPSITYSGLGTLNFDVNATITNLNLQGSSFRGAGAITIPTGGSLTVNGTTLGGFSAFTLAAGATGNTTNAAFLRPVTNLGTLNVTGISSISTIPSAAGANNGSLTNGATGVLNLNGAYLQPLSNGIFTNSLGGQVVVQSGFNTIDASGNFFSPTQVGTITNNGGVTVNAGAALLLTNGFASINSGSYTTAVGGTLSFNKATGAPALASYTNSGAFNNNGTMNFLGNGYTLSGAMTQAGTLDIATGVVLNKPNGFTNAGTISGTGTLAVGVGAAGLTNQGTISPAGAATAGTLTITGDLKFGAGSTVNIELGGSTAGTFDVLAVNGAVSGIGGSFGNLSLSQIGAYTIANGNTFIPMTATSGLNTGTFTRNPIAGVLVTPTYAPASLSLAMTTGLTLTVSANALSKMFGTGDPALTYTVNGFVAGDSAATILSGGLIRVAGEGVGAYAITQGSLAVSPLGYYSIVFNGNTFTIVPAPAPVVTVAAPVTLTPAVANALTNISVNMPTLLSVNSTTSTPTVMVAASGDITVDQKKYAAAEATASVVAADAVTNTPSNISIAQPMVGCQ